ncbi:MAG: DUF1778 domain-containing protein, partial [Okeania sp. SIO2H7]|nr:DUF1778 domain-containing protein [Okeania sp. SIO2H7]
MSESTNITLTINPEQKQKLEKAAALRCLSISEYLLQLALDAATEEIPEPEAIIASDRDWEIIESAILNPPELNEALKAAIKEHQQNYGGFKDLASIDEITIFAKNYFLDKQQYLWERIRYLVEVFDEDEGDEISVGSLKSTILFLLSQSQVKKPTLTLNE